MSKSYYQIKKEVLGESNSNKNSNKTSEKNAKKSRINYNSIKEEVLNGNYDFSFIRHGLERKIGFDTFGADLSSMGSTIGDAFGGWQSPETMSNLQNSVSSMQERLSAYNEYRRMFGNGTDMPDLSELSSAYGSASTDIGKLAERYSGYANANEYDTVSGLYGMSADEIKKRWEHAKILDEANKGYNLVSKQSEKAITDADKKIYAEGLKREEAKREEFLKGKGYTLDELQKSVGNYVSGDIAYTTADGQNITWKDLYENTKYQEDHNARYKEVSSFGDFEHYKEIGENVENPTYEEVYGGIRIAGWSPFGKDIINEVKFAKDNFVTVTMGNHFDPSDENYIELTNEEYDIYNFYLGQEIEGVAEKGTADAYLKSIYDRLKDRRENKWAIGMSKYADEHPISASGISVFQNLASGAEFLGDAARYVGSGMKGEMDDNSLARYSSAIRGTVSDKVDWEIGNWDAFDFVYNTTMSGIDSAVAMGTLGMGGGYALGLSAAAQGTNDALDRGLDSKHAFWNGIASGVFEGLFESVSIGNFESLKGLPVDGVKSLAKEIGKSMLVNASEETLTEVANVLYDTIVNGDFSQYETDIRAYMSAGMSEEDAKRKVALEQGARIAEAGASGALMGFGFGAIGGASSYAKTSATGKSIRANERASDMFDIASNPEIGSAYETYTQYANQKINAENAKNAQIGRLYMEAESDARNTLNDKKATDLQKSMALKNLGDLSVVETENIIKKNAKEEFNVGDETKVTDTGESIDTKNIKVEGDKITIATENGKVSVDDVTLSERDAELAYVAKEIAKENGDDIANLFLEQYDGKTDVEAYQNSFNMVMEYAKGDFTFEEMMKHKGSLSATEVSKIYEETVLKTYKEQQSKIDKLIQDTADQRFYKGSIEESAITNKVWKKLDTRQRKAITFIKGLAKATGMNLVLTHNPNSKTGGSFDPSTNTITIDVAKFKDSMGVLRETIIPTMSHEMTHWMEEKSPELYRKLSDLVFSTLQEADGMSESTRLDIEYRNQKAKGREYSNKELRSEIVARACEDILSMSEQGQKLFDSLSESEKQTLGAKIKEILHNLMDMIQKMLGTYKSNTDEAKALQKYQDKLQEIAKIWDEMLLKSVEANQALEKSGVFGELTNGISEDGTTIIGKNTLQMSDRTYREGGREFLVNWLNQHSGLSEDDRRNIVEQTDKIAELMRAIEKNESLPDYSKWANMEVVKDENGEKVVSVIVKNGDYAMNIDFSQVCKKRVALNSVLNAMVKSGDLNVHTLTETDVAELNAIIKSHEFEIACALCFVDAKRYRVGSWAESFCEGSDEKKNGKTVHKYGFNEMVRSLIPKDSKIQADEFNFTGRDIKNQPTQNLLSDAKDSELDFSLIDEIMKNNDSKSAQHRYAKAIKENSELRKILNHAEIISSIGLDAIRLESPKLYGLINGHQGTAKPKFAHDVTAYANDILKANNFTPEKAKMVGGVRVQSFSDFMANMVVDYVQLISELSAKQLTSHSYTKEALFVKLFGLTGMKINMSLVPKAVDLTEEQQKYFAILKDKNANKRSKEYKQKLEEYNSLAENTGLDENGDYIWEDESFPYDIAMDIQVDPRYSANCGTIAVGISNNHILKLLADDRISMVIPYHKSSLNHEVAMMRDIALYKDYTDVQNTRNMGTGKKLDSKKGEVDFDFYGDLYGTDGKEGTHNPKETAKNYLKWCDENNYIPKFDEFRGHKNYYKLLIDFRVYDTDGTYREQQAVQPIYPSEAEFKDLILNGVIGKDGTVYGGLKQQQETSDKLSNESQQIVEEFKQRLKDKYGKDVLHSDRVTEITEDDYKKINNGYSDDFIDKTIKSFGIQKLGDFIHVQKQVLNTLIEENFFTDAENRRRVDVNKDSGMIIETNKSGIDETFDLNNYAHVGKNKKITKLATIRMLPEIIKNGKLVSDNVQNKYGDGNSKKFAYIEYTLELDGKEVTIQLDIKKSPQKNKFWVHRVLEKENVSNSPASTNKGTEAGHSIADIDRSISHLEENVKHSDRDNVSVYDIIGERDRILKENEQFRKEIENLKERVELEKKVTNGTVLNNNSLLAAAAHLRNIANSNMDKVELAKALKEVYSFILTSKELTWEEVYERCLNVADAMLKEAKPKVEVNEFYKGIVADIKKTKVSFSESQKMAARHIFDKNWNRYFFGRITISDSGIPLESMWADWSQQYPDIFRADINDGDMVRELYDVLGSLQSASEIAMEYNEEETKRYFAQEIYNQFWNVSTITTTADKYDKQIKLLKSKHRSYMAEVRESYKSRIDEKLKAQHKADKEKANELYKKLRERKDKEIALAKERGKERLSKYKDNAERKTHIQRITSNILSLNDMLVKNSKDKHVPEILKGPVITLIQSIDFSSKRMLEKGEPTKKDISFAKALGKVKDMMVKATNAHDELVELYGHGLDEDIEKMVEHVDALAEIIGDNELVLNRMSLIDLQTLDKMVKTIKVAVSKMNKFHTVNHARGIASLSQESVSYLDSLGKGKIYDGLRGGAKKLLNWGNALPYYVFKRFGSGGMKVYEALQDGWDKFAFNVKKIIDYTNSVYTSKEVKEWSEDVKTFKIKIPTDLESNKQQYQEVQMTVPQIMSMYCLAKREQAKGHLFGGGIRVADFKNKKGEIVSQAEGIIFTESDILQILDSLTDRQKEVADKLQRFMNTICSDWGNEVSMARFGYKAFGEDNYFPIQSDDNNLSVNDATEQPNSLFKLLNMAFTKSTIDKANNRIIIGDIFDVFAQHTSDMAKYNALALPVLDSFKWYNYKEKLYTTEDKFITKGVKQSIENAFGKDGKNYFTTFLKDINGQQEVSRDTLGKGFFSNAKIASVGMNLRVMLLQPTSYVRASAVIDNKYLLKALGHKPKIKRAETHCGIALWKSMGYYDTNIQRGVEAQIKHNERLKDKITDWSMKGAEWADKVTWGYLWNACELEIRDTRKDLKVGSEEFYTEIGKRLREIIYATQVVDSTMTRSQMMRSSDGRDKMLTAFASEPTLAYNMLQDAYMGLTLDARRMGKKEAWKKNGKKVARTLYAYTMTNALAALIESAFDAFRDDDDEEMDMLMFMKYYFSNFASDMSIGSKIPYVKELYSFVQGFGSSRSDTQWMENMTKAITTWYKIFNGKKNAPTTAIKYSIKAISDLSGIPVYNVYRDMMATFNKLDLFTADDLNEMFEDFLN